MSTAPSSDQIAHELRTVVGLLRRRLRQTGVDGELTMPESSALARLDRGGPATAAALAKTEQISPQSVGVTLARLQRRGLIAGEPDPADGRRVVLSLTAAGAEAVRGRRSARAAQLARALESEFSGPELRTLASAVGLLERLAEAL